MKRAVPLLVCVFCCASAHADTRGKLKPPDLAQYIRWGPIRVRPGFQVSDFGYDDNILRSRGNQDRLSDYTATMSAKLDGLMLFGDRAFLTLREKYDYTMYLEYNDQNHDNFRSQARLTVPFQKLGFFTDVTWIDVQERPVDLEDERPERRERRYGVGMVVQTGWRTELEVAQRTTDVAYLDPGFAKLDRRENATSLEASYLLHGRVHALLETEFKNIAFDQPVVGTDTSRDTRQWKVLGGIDFGTEGPLSGSVKTGWSRIDAKDPSLPDLSEVVGEAEVAFRVGSRTRLVAEGARLPGFAVFEEDTSYYLHTTYGLRAVRYLNRFLGVELARRRGRLTFPESSSSGRQDHSREYEGGFRFRVMDDSLGRRVEYSLIIGRYRRSSTAEEFDLSQTRISAGAVLGF